MSVSSRDRATSTHVPIGNSIRTRGSANSATGKGLLESHESLLLFFGLRSNGASSTSVCVSVFNGHHCLGCAPTSLPDALCTPASEPDPSVICNLLVSPSCPEFQRRLRDDVAHFQESNCNNTDFVHLPQNFLVRLCAAWHLRVSVVYASVESQGRFAAPLRTERGHTRS